MSHFFAKLAKILLFFTYVMCVYEAVKAENIKTSDDSPQETQHAICKVFTKEIEATAKATITRQLKGVCSAKELNANFERLQATIFQELQDIKKALGLQSAVDYERLNPINTSTRPPSTTSSAVELPTYDYQDYLSPEVGISPIKSSHIKNLEHYHAQSNDIPDDVDVNDEMLMLEQTRAHRNDIPDDAGVNDEILMFNDTIVESSEEGDLYFYYWKIVEIGKVLKKRNVYVSSPSFSVLGHTLYLQIYPNYLDEFVGILLKPDSNSFLKKHKIMFLGQTRTQNQISSKILYGVKNEDKIFKIEPQMLDGNFVFGDSLLVKLKIYLNS